MSILILASLISIVPFQGIVFTDNQTFMVIKVIRCIRPILRLIMAMFIYFEIHIDIALIGLTLTSAKEAVPTSKEYVLQDFNVLRSKAGIADIISIYNHIIVIYKI